VIYNIFEILLDNVIIWSIMYWKRDCACIYETCWIIQ